MRDRFRTAGLDSPDRDARLIAEMAFGLGGVALAGAERAAASADAMARLDGLAARRLAGEPVARLAGEKEFYGLAFGLNADTLVPRPETELLVDLALAALPDDRPTDLLDLGSGTGCIAIAILAHRPLARAVAVDVSATALSAVAANAARHGVAGRLETRLGSWFDPLRGGERFHVIVSNPPYIESGAIAGLAREVRAYDPRLALDGGEDGLGAYRTILSGAAARLRPGGLLALEIGATQGGAVEGLAVAAGLAGVTVKKDLAGLDRAVVGHHVGR